MSATTKVDWPVGIKEIINRQSFLERLATGRPLRVKWGIDPTSADLHLGHGAVLRVLRWFQDQGHQVMVVIGDFTAGIGDPSGVNVTRPILTRAEISANLTDYFDQLGRVLDMNRLELVHNRDWLASMTLADFLALSMKISLNSLTERQDFRDRLKNHQSVGLHEVLYAIIQAADSVHLQADVEVGGEDQLLNLLTGRELQGKLGQKPQEIVLVKLLVGTDGIKKMSKSAGNVIPLKGPADQMFGQIMSMPDSAIVAYAELGAGLSPKSIKGLPKHPKEAKEEVATQIVANYFSVPAAEEALKRFQAVYGRKDPANQAQLAVEIALGDPNPFAWSLVSVCAEVSGMAARRLISQKAVKLNGRGLTNFQEKLTLKSDDILQIGRHRFFRLRVR